MKLNKLRKAAMTIEFVIVVSILVLIGCLGTAYVYSQYDTLTDKANKVEDSIIIKGDGTVVGGGSQEEEGGSENGGETPTNVEFWLYMYDETINGYTANTGLSVTSGTNFYDIVNAGWMPELEVEDGFVLYNGAYLYYDTGETQPVYPEDTVTENIQLYYGKPVVKSFTVYAWWVNDFNGESIEITYEEGMTWLEWGNSDYVNDRFSVSDGSVYFVHENTKYSLQYMVDEDTNYYDNVYNGDEISASINYGWFS